MSYRRFIGLTLTGVFVFVVSWAEAQETNVAPPREQEAIVASSVNVEDKTLSDSQSPLTRQADFETFWKTSLAELAKVEPAFKVVAKPEWNGSNANVFEVRMRSFGDVHVAGWLEVPTSAGPHPALLILPGYGQSMEPIDVADDMIVFSFNPRGHGNSQEDVPGEPVDYWIRGLDDKAKYFYRGAFLDCVRAVDFITSRTDVDAKRIAVWGESQGGGLAFATAALDPRVDFCAADIPFLCDWANYFKLSNWPEMDEWIAADTERSWTSTLQTLSYFDTLNLADRIQCPTVMGVGLQDKICPPPTSFATFNRIPGRKSFKTYKDAGHGLGADHRKWIWRQLRAEFNMK